MHSLYGWVHPIGNLMLIPRIQFTIAGVCDPLSMESVHTSLEWLRCKFAQKPCVSFGPFQVRLQPKIWAEVGPETVNEDARLL